MSLTCSELREENARHGDAILTPSHGIHSEVFETAEFGLESRACCGVFVLNMIDVGKLTRMPTHADIKLSLAVPPLVTLYLH